ncbi:MAG: hypothetical protein ACFE0R_06755 [Salinarimonas sp.]
MRVTVHGQSEPAGGKEAVMTSFELAVVVLMIAQIMATLLVATVR